VYSNVGIRKYFTSGATGFTFPLGVNGKYTPAELTIDNNSSTGFIRVNVINDRHPAVSDDSNVLQYYWEVASSGISAFEGSMLFNYSDSDVEGNENEYVAARLIVPPGTDWSKAAPGPTTDNVDETLNQIIFEFPSGTTNLGGEYTAGNDSAIPDQVPVFTSNGDGNWDDVNIWSPEAPAGGPNGFIVIIREGDSISTNGNRRFAYRTTINGTLDVSATYGHNLGSVNGAGKLYLTGPVIPAGRLNSFLSCGGGTLEFGGYSDYTIIADRIDTVSNLFFTGTGTRVLPDKDLVICNLLKIDGPALDNSLFNRKITILGSIERLNSGSFNSGTGTGATVTFKGYVTQQLGGTSGNFTGSNAFNNLEIDNSQGLQINGPMELKGNLLLTQGLINTSTSNLLSMTNWNSTVIPDGGSNTSYINGPLEKAIFEGDSFNFPTGKNSRYGKTSIHSAGAGTWRAEYFNSGHPTTGVTAPLFSISRSEYWNIAGPTGNQAFVQLRWNEQSDITPLTTENGMSDIKVAEFNTGTNLWEEKNTIVSGNDQQGTARTSDKMDLDEHIYTLASISSVKPKAGFGSQEDACTGEGLSISFSNTASAYTFTWNVDGGPGQEVTTSSNPYILATSVPGRYRITDFVGGIADTSSVLVHATPVSTFTASETEICSGESITFTAGGGTNYNFIVNGVSVQNGTTSTYISNSLINNSVVYVIVSDLITGCSDVSDDITITVNARPVPTLSGSIITCTEAIETYSTESGMSAYTWSFTGGSIAAGGGLNDESITILWETTGTHQITVNYENDKGCAAVDETRLEVEIFKRPETGPAYFIPNNFMIN